MPKIPVGGNKRRMPDAPTPEMLKRMKIDISPEPSETGFVGTGPSTDPSMSRSVTVEDADDEEAIDVDRDFAPGGDADYFAEEDEEGRFYGGGLTKEQKDILNIFASLSYLSAHQAGLICKKR